MTPSGFSLDETSGKQNIACMNQQPGEPEMRELQLAIDAFATEAEDSWIRFRRDRHQTPETSGNEFQTSRTIADRLSELGLTPVIPTRGVGVVADLTLGTPAPDASFVAVRGDIDALKMPDRKECQYSSSVEGVAHACGHDAHTTIALGVAETLTQLTRMGGNLPAGRVRFIFQAAEETGDGAQWMIDDGYLEDVTSILGLHVEPNFVAGEIGVRYGTLTAAVDELTIRIEGNGGHTARPHMTTDPIHCAAMLVSHLYEILPRSVDVRDSSVFSVGKLHSGHAANVIPDEATIVGTLRTTSDESREILHQRIRKSCEHFADLSGNEISIERGHALNSVVNSASETECIEIAATDVIGRPSIHNLDRPSMGGEDFGVYMSACRGSQFRLGCAKSLPWPHLHSPVFDIDERCLAIGVRILSRATLELLERQS